MDLNFPSILWKRLVSQEVNESDVLAIDILSFKIIDQLEALRSSPDITPELLESIDQRFVVSGSDEQEHELLPCGSTRLVTLENFNQFVRLYRNV